MLVHYRDSEAVSGSDGFVHLTCRLQNAGSAAWRASERYAIGWQIYDPDTSLFISEGEWQSLSADVAPGAEANVSLSIALPAEPGHYRIYVSALDSGARWLYTQGEPFLIVDANVGRAGALHVSPPELTTLRKLRRRNFAPALGHAFTEPFSSLWNNRALIGSLARREILARYRGSFGDAAWTILHPLLLMLTYFFVFGVVLQSRFGGDPSRSGFALYFLAGMLPWLAFSEPVGRAAAVILEHRNFVKKLVFPVSILPVIPTVVGLVTSLFATALFFAALLAVRGAIPWTAILLPVLLIPQLLFTLGLCWFLASLGVFVRDLAQVMSSLLTLWFFITPICYAEASLPAVLVPLLAQNPLFQIVRGYRQLLLEGVMPDPMMLLKLWSLAIVVFIGGHAWFSRLRRTFADAV